VGDVILVAGGGVRVCHEWIPKVLVQ
jgi:hypothetical protein